MTCPHPDSTCLVCETYAYQDGADLIDDADRDCSCGCSRVAVEGETVRCLGCEVAP